MNQENNKGNAGCGIAVIVVIVLVILAALLGSCDDSSSKSSSSGSSSYGGSSHSCYVCGEPASHKYGSHYYCTTHYAMVKTVVENG